MTRSQGPRRILLVTNVDRGEANIFLATCQALYEADPAVELHFATFTGLEESINSVWKNACHTIPSAKPMVFHKIHGLSMTDGLRQYFARNNLSYSDGYLPPTFLTPLQFSSTVKAIRDTIPIMVPYSGPQLGEIVSSIVDIINEVSADLVVVDSLMTPALTACYHLGVKFTCLSPNAIKEFAAPLQPRAAGLWKFPALFSGYSYPVPLHLVPLNVFFAFYTAWIFIKDAHRHEVAKHLASELNMTLRTPVDLLRNRPEGLKILVSTLPELDFSAICPEHVYPCGPIIQITLPIEKSDPEMETWLARGSTIYVNLGSICRLSEDRALNLAKALRRVINQVKRHPEAPHLQVLWKLKKLEDYGTSAAGSKIYDVLGAEIDADQVRVVDWVKAEPISILKTKDILCSVHHGGANSYNEAILAGVRQVVLPQWTDCYDYAQRVEMLGIGRIGNSTLKPQWSEDELARELLEVAFGEQSDAMKRRARDLAAICTENGEGAANAARILLAECNEK